MLLVAARRLACQRRPAPIALSVTARALAQRTGKAALDLTELRLISETGAQLGLMPPKQALTLATAQQLELREVSATAEPPVWKLFAVAGAGSPSPSSAADQSRGPRQQQQQRQRPLTPKKTSSSSSSNKKPPKLKEVRVTDRSDLRDADTKAASAMKFLKKGHVVKVFALNTGVVDEESGKARAVVLVERVLEVCSELADHAGVGGRTQIPAGYTSRNVLGKVEATLTPKGGPSRAAPEPRRVRPASRARGRDAGASTTK